MQFSYLPTVIDYDDLLDLPPSASLERIEKRLREIEEYLDNTAWSDAKYLYSKEEFRSKVTRLTARPYMPLTDYLVGSRGTPRPSERDQKRSIRWDP